MKLDLHGKTWNEAKADFIEAYNEIHSQPGHDTLDIVHGYGSTGQGGVIRGRIRAYLDRYPNHLNYKTGESFDGNKGHTIVTPVKPLPSLENQLGEEIWDYCSEPRPLSKIASKFHRQPFPKIQQAIEELVSQRRLIRKAGELSRL